MYARINIRERIGKRTEVIDRKAQCWCAQRLFKLSLIIKNNERKKCFLTTTQTTSTLANNASGRGGTIDS